MKSTSEIKRLAKRMRFKPSSATDKRILALTEAALEKTDRTKEALEVQRNLQQQSISGNQLDIWRIIMKSKIAALSSAAAIIFCVLGLLIFLGNGETLYAQVVKAFEKARSIHVIMKEYRDGHWFKDHEIWYDCEEGVREEERYENQEDIRIDNKQYEWRYKVGDVLAAKVSSYRDPDEWAKNLYEWLSFDPERLPSGDKVINGVPCKMYTLSMPDGRKLARIWVNEDHCILKLEYEGQEDEQVITAVANIDYNKEIDKRLFSPEFGTNVEIVGPRELRELIEEQFPLETAIFKRESLGFVYSVHKLEFGNRFKYLVCSNRLTEQTRDKISGGNPWTYYGGFDLFGRYDESGMYLDTSDEPILLAQMRHDGIQVEWHILIPSGSKAKQAASCDVDVRVNTANQLEEKLKAEGLPIREKFRLNITPGEAKEQLLSLREIASQIYSLGKEFAPIVHVFNLTKIVTEPDGNKIRAWKELGTELSEEDYTKDIESRVEYYLNRN